MNAPLTCAILALAAQPAAADSISPTSETTDANGLRHLVYKYPNGNTGYDTYLAKPSIVCLEGKVVDKAGNVTQWYQYFPDRYGRIIVEIVRKTLGNHPSYNGIVETFVHSYNSNGNESESYEYLGDGRLKSHVVDVYDSSGKWIRADCYNSSGKLTGSIETPPEAYLYGEKHA